MHLCRGNYVILRRRGISGAVERIGRVTSSHPCSSKRNRHCVHFSSALAQMRPCIACMEECIRIHLVYIKEAHDPKWRVPRIKRRKQGLLFANYNCTKITLGELALIKLEVGQ